MERRYSIANDRSRYRRRDSVKTTVIKQFCCFCLDLRIACIVIGILNTLIGISSFGTVYYQSLTWNIGLGAASTIFAGVILTLGAIKNHYIATIVSLAIVTISLVTYFCNSVYILVKTHEQAKASGNIGHENHVEEDLVGGIFLIMTLVQLYFWTCVFGFLKQLRNNTIIPRIIVV